MLFAWQRRVTFGSDAANEFLLIDFWFVGVKTVPFEIGIKKNLFHLLLESFIPIYLFAYI